MFRETTGQLTMERRLRIIVLLTFFTSCSRLQTTEQPSDPPRISATPKPTMRPKPVEGGYSGEPHPVFLPGEEATPEVTRRVMQKYQEDLRDWKERTGK